MLKMLAPPALLPYKMSPSQAGQPPPRLFPGAQQVPAAGSHSMSSLTRHIDHSSVCAFVCSLIFEGLEEGQ